MLLDSILPALALLSKVGVGPLNFASALSTKLMSYSKSAIVLSTIFTATPSGIDFSSKDFLCPYCENHQNVSEWRDAVGIQAPIDLLKAGVAPKPSFFFFFKVTAVKPVIRSGVTTCVEKEITGSRKAGLKGRGWEEEQRMKQQVWESTWTAWIKGLWLEFHNVTEPSDQHTRYQLKSKLKLLRRWKGFNVFTFRLILAGL